MITGLTLCEAEGGDLRIPESSGQIAGYVEKSFDRCILSADLAVSLRVWCNGSTAAFQASGEGSNPFTRLCCLPLKS